VTVHSTYTVTNII